MKKPYLSESKTRAISLSIMLLGFAVLSFTDTWWPWLMAVIGLSVVVKQVLRAKFYEAFISAIVFGGVVVTTGLNIAGRYFLPVILMVGSIYILTRAFFQSDIETEDELEAEQNKELEEESEEDLE